ncbi:hypothetical protein CHCC20375_0519 [Bacillus licheniformis]|nr:hypothetical protein CHCC20375_0519 [Bacillus licheniformis]
MVPFLNRPSKRWSVLFLRKKNAGLPKRVHHKADNAYSQASQVK